MSTVYTFQTFQQAQAAGEQPDFIRRFVQQHCTSGPYKMALDADLYDAQNFRVIDHKCLGSSTHDKLRTQGPPRHYYVQLLLYALGYIRAGYTVRSIAIAAWPRTGSSLAASAVRSRAMSVKKP